VFSRLPINLQIPFSDSQCYFQIYFRKKSQTTKCKLVGTFGRENLGRYWPSMLRFNFFITFLNGNFLDNPSRLFLLVVNWAKISPSTLYASYGFTLVSSNSKEYFKIYKAAPGYNLIEGNRRPLSRNASHLVSRLNCHWCNSGPSWHGK